MEEFMADLHDGLTDENESYYENSAGQYIFVTPEENILIYLRKKLGLDYIISLIIGLTMTIAFFIAVIAVAVFVVGSSINAKEHSLLTGIVVAIIFCGADALALAVIFAILKTMLGEKLLITPEMIIRKCGIFSRKTPRSHNETIEIGVYCDSEFDCYCADVQFSYGNKTDHLLDSDEFETKSEADSEAAAIFRILSGNQTHVEIKMIE